MTQCAEVRAELVALDREELPAPAAAALRTHLTACLGCAAELAEIRRVTSAVRATTEIAPAPAWSARLRARLDEELAVSATTATTMATTASRQAPVRSLPSLRERLRGTWEYARWRYEKSASVRRFTLASIALHAAALALAAWLVVGDRITRDPKVGMRLSDPSVARLFEEEERPDDLRVERPNVGPLDLPVEYGVDLPFDPATAQGVTPPPPLPRGFRSNEPLPRFPTMASMVRLRVVFDESEKLVQLRAAADTAAPAAREAVHRGLASLANRQQPDGTWGAAGQVDPTTRGGVTAMALLAFASDGQSAREGPYAERLARTVRWLERTLDAGIDAGAVAKPIYAHALAVRALTVQYAVDFRYLTAAEREARRALLERAGTALLDWQGKDGGFGYEPRSPRSDASCTLFASGALAELRYAGVLDTKAALAQAGAFLGGLRSPEGRLDYRLAGDRVDDPALTAGLLALDTELGVRDEMPGAVALVERCLTERLSERQFPDSLLTWAGIGALRRHQRPVAGAVRSLLASQRADGSWPAAQDRHLAGGGDDLTTAVGVLSVTRVYLP